MNPNCFAYCLNHDPSTNSNMSTKSKNSQFSRKKNFGSELLVPLKIFCLGKFVTSLQCKEASSSRTSAFDKWSENLLAWLKGRWIYASGDPQRRHRFAHHRRTYSFCFCISIPLRRFSPFGDAFSSWNLSGRILRWEVSDQKRVINKIAGPLWLVVDSPLPIHGRFTHHVHENEVASALVISTATM